MVYPVCSGVDALVVDILGDIETTAGRTELNDRSAGLSKPPTSSKVPISADARRAHNDKLAMGLAQHWRFYQPFESGHTERGPCGGGISFGTGRSGAVLLAIGENTAKFNSPPKGHENFSVATRCSPREL